MSPERDAGRVKSIEAVAVVPGPPESVFHHLVSEQGATSWRVGVVRWELLSRAPLVEGARIEETRNVLGKPRTCVLTVARLDPPRVLEFAREDGARFAFELAPAEGAGGGTRVAYRMTPPPDGFTARLAALVRRPADRARLAAQLEALRSEVERRRRRG